MIRAERDIWFALQDDGGGAVMRGGKRSAAANWMSFFADLYRQEATATT